MFTGILPEDQIACNKNIEPILLNAIDNCGDVFVTLTEIEDTITFKPVVVLTRIWTASDKCNNTTTHQQVITILPANINTIEQVICEE